VQKMGTKGRVVARKLPSRGRVFVQKMNTKDVSLHENCHQEDDTMCKVVLKGYLWR